MPTSLKETLASGGGGFRLAPDLTWPGTKNPSRGSKAVTVNPSTGLVTALSLSGKWVLSLLSIDSGVSDTLTVKLTIDGIVIWNDDVTFGGDLSLLGIGYGAATGDGSFVNDTLAICDSSIVLELQSTSVTSVTVNYLARPIL